ncbi:30S ribosomal protein S13 [Candidatus Pacearchaeota archaeon]|nr:30S ribosomal protein S13 [Candidatus Pacearchaeota archaeon]
MKKQETKEKVKEDKIKDRPSAEQQTESLIRILDKDIKSSKKVIVGLTRIKGVSWAVSNGICSAIKINPAKKIGDLSKEEIKTIEEFIKNPKLPSFLLNRRKDANTGEDRHLTSTDLDLRKEFDIKLLKKIRSYRGLRHALGLPTRGQRTKSHFRENKKSRISVGVGASKNKPVEGKSGGR